MMYRVAPFLVFGLLAANSQAALFDRGGGLIYDDQLDVTWLQDVTYVIDQHNAAGANVGRAVDWYTATDWVTSLSYYDSVRETTSTGWRLPEISGYDADSFASSGTGSNSQVNELAHMYYNNLGFDAYTGDKSDPHSIPLPTLFSTSPNTANVDLFTNLENAFLGTWSGNQADNGRVWGFHMHFGDTTLDASNGWDTQLIWAVHDGDVALSAVPVPPALWLMGSGMVLMGFVSKKRRSAKAPA